MAIKVIIPKTLQPLIHSQKSQQYYFSSGSWFTSVQGNFKQATKQAKAFFKQEQHTNFGQIVLDDIA